MVPEIYECLQKAWDRVNPLLALLWAAVCWVLFPEAAYIPAAIAVGIAVMLDLVSKIYALSVTGGGYIRATREHRINSDVLWRGTRTKIFAYFGTMILAGLAVRVAPLKAVGTVVSTVVYSMIFIREWQSVTENFIDAGAISLRPILFFLRRKERDLLNDRPPTENGTPSGDQDPASLPEGDG